MPRGCGDAADKWDRRSYHLLSHMSDCSRGRPPSVVRAPFAVNAALRRVGTGRGRGRGREPHRARTALSIRRVYM